MGSEFEGNYSDTQGKNFSEEGVRSFIEELSGDFSEEDLREVNNLVDETLASEFPTPAAVEEALAIPDNKKKFLFLALFSEKKVKQALAGKDYKPGSEDLFAGFYLDSMAETLNKEVQKRNLPPNS